MMIDCDAAHMDGVAAWAKTKWQVRAIYRQVSLPLWNVGRPMGGAADTRSGRFDSAFRSAPGKGHGLAFQPGCCNIASCNQESQGPLAAIGYDLRLMLPCWCTNI